MDCTKLEPKKGRQYIYIWPCRCCAKLNFGSRKKNQNHHWSMSLTIEVSYTDILNCQDGVRRPVTVGSFVGSKRRRCWKSFCMTCVPVVVLYACHVICTFSAHAVEWRTGLVLQGYIWHCTMWALFTSQGMQSACFMVYQLPVHAAASTYSTFCQQNSRVQLASGNFDWATVL